MKPVCNTRTTPFDIGDVIAAKFEQLRGSPVCYKIIKLSICQTTGNPCNTCNTGNIAYTVKRFKKRLGSRTFTFCPIRNGVNDYYKCEPFYGEADMKTVKNKSKTFCACSFDPPELYTPDANNIIEEARQMQKAGDDDGY